MTYYHGGRPNVPRGAFLLPPAITKAPSLAQFGAAGICRTDRVYVTTSHDAALMYAAGQRNGVIYEVEPLGVIEADPDCSMPGLSYQCERAKVIRIIKPSATVLHMVREALFSDRAAAAIGKDMP